MADPIANLVYASDPSSIETVIVGGDVIVEENKFLNNDVSTVVADVQLRAKDLRKRVGLSEIKWQQNMEME